MRTDGHWAEGQVREALSPSTATAPSIEPDATARLADALARLLAAWWLAHRAEQETAAGGEPAAEQRTRDESLPGL